VVIRGSFGNFVIAMNSKFEHVYDAISTEAHTMKERLILVQSVRCNRIILELDCLEVINIMRERENFLDIVATVIDDFYYLVSDFPRVIFEHSYRKANCVAHGLAMVGKGINGASLADDPSDFLILDDITSILNE
jgi:formate-dependent phosphoribosylglycinamide formyltransferase (GAR transformylase)